MSSKLVSIVKLLSDKAYHDGDSIGKTLAITRSAVWKLINRLKKHGVAIDAIKGKGYVMQDPLQLLDGAAIQAKLNEAKVGSSSRPQITIFETIDSTNDYLQSQKQKKALMICLAEQQTQGKGRLGRTWYSPFAENLYFSCLYRFENDISELAGLSLVVGLAVMNTLNSYLEESKQRFQVKWPNDIYYAGSKVAGSLLQIQAEAHGASCATIGIGINVNMLDDAAQIKRAWTSLRQVLGVYVDRNELCARLIVQLNAQLQQFTADGLAPFVQLWAQADVLTNKTITLQRAQEAVTGTATGINHHGHLLLRLTNGELASFSSGDASVVM